MKMLSMYTHGFAAALAVALAVAAAPAAAQKLYRCGNAYQDRPCNTSQPAGKVVGSTGANNTAAQPVVDAACRKRGAGAQSIMWAREAGRTEAEQLAQAATDDDRELISEVYARRGSAQEVRTAMEAECMEQKVRPPGAAAPGGAKAAEAPAAAATPAAATPPKPADAQREQTARQAADAGAKKARCADLKAQAEAIRGSQRAGGNTAAMEALNQQYRAAVKAQNDAGC
jgi:hypothetical protein